jgi:hypothetical protein
MKFLEKLGLKKKKKKEDEVVVVQPQPNRLSRIMKALNKPSGGAIGFNPMPQRTPMEKQLGLPEYVSPLERAPDFTSKPKPIPKIKKAKTSWRPTPGVPYKNGDGW